MRGSMLHRLRLVLASWWNGRGRGADEFARAGTYPAVSDDAARSALRRTTWMAGGDVS